MRPREIAHRIGEQIRLRWMRLIFSVNGGHGPDGALEWTQFKFCTATDAQLPSLLWRFPDDEEFLSSRLKGAVGALGYPWSWRDVRGAWHEAPDTGKQWPEVFFASIPYRAGNPYGDIRVAWEPSRLQHLIDLSWVASNINDERGDQALRLLEKQFLSWCNENPPWRGIHYISAMECALRIISVAYALDRARIRLTAPPEVWGAYAGMVKAHADLIMRRLSLFSSTGNHTIAEAAGLVYAGLLFPEMKSSIRWLERGLGLLEVEADHQILPDGGGTEQALWYHLFVVDLYGLVAELLTSRRRKVPLPIVGALQRGRTFLSAFGNNPNALPAIGDGDSGFALSRHLRLNWQSAEVKQGRLTTFSYAGYSIVRNPERSGLELILDHGPLGMSPAYGHGHADALSVILRLGGEPVVIDTGTYTYTGHPKWRSYFRGTRAHNTVVVDNRDQAVQAASFQWSRPFSAELAKAIEMNDGSVKLLARHSGYQHLGVTHWRAILWEPSGVIWVWDYLDGAGTHQLQLHWHVDADAVPSGDGLYSVKIGQASVAIGIWGGELSHCSAATEPPGGWKSEVYGRKQPITTITCKCYGGVPHEFTTCISAQKPFVMKPFAPNVRAEFRKWIQ